MIAPNNIYLPYWVRDNLEVNGVLFFNLNNHQNTGLSGAQWRYSWGMGLDTRGVRTYVVLISSTGSLAIGTLDTAWNDWKIYEFTG